MQPARSTYAIKKRLEFFFQQNNSQTPLKQTFKTNFVILIFPIKKTMFCCTMFLFRKKRSIFHLFPEIKFEQRSAETQKCKLANASIQVNVDKVQTCLQGQSPSQTHSKTANLSKSTRLCEKQQDTARLCEKLLQELRKLQTLDEMMRYAMFCTQR